MQAGHVVAGRYRVGRLLGRGGMGAVYEAVDQQTDRTRAIKLMLGHRVDDADARARFAREARLAGRIDSPFVVDVLDAGVDADDGTPYLVMELLTGENLEQRLHRLGARPADEVIDCLAQLACALVRMHARHVVHRDLKPSNLFVEPAPGGGLRLKVVDLGVAKILSATGADTTAVVGSLPYMAPEQIRGLAIGPAADLYALGLIAYTLLVGAPYWQAGDGESPIALAMRIAGGTAAPASERARARGAELPAAFDAWFVRATAARPGQRFASANDAVAGLAAVFGAAAPVVMADALPRPVIDEHASTHSAEPALGATETAGEVAEATPVTVVARKPPPRVDPAPPKRRWRWAIAVALAVIAVPFVVRRATVGPLAAPRSVLACPILDVDGDPATWGWLGAAAAAIACERARVVLGGPPSRTRVPAELLDVRGERAIEDDPYGAPDARAKSLAAATHADAYLDGSVARLGTEQLAPRFRVTLILRGADQRERARGSGESAALYDAVRAAMAGVIPTDAPLDPVIADYAQAFDRETQLHLLDLTLAIANNAGTLPDDCAWFARPDAAASTSLAPFVRYECQYTLGAPTGEVALPTGASIGARVARARVAHMVHHQRDAAAIDELGAAYAREPSAWGKSVIASTLSCLTQASAPDESFAWATRAIDEPKNPTGEWCSPWGQLMSLADDTAGKHRAATGWPVWVPWDSYAWRFAARNARDERRARELTERAYILSPLDTNLADDLGRALVRGGQIARTEVIARRLAGSRYPVHQVMASALTAQLDASEARFARGLAAARAGMRPRPDDAGWVRAQRLDLAWRAVELANLLGRAAEVADEAATTLTAQLDWASLDTAREIAAICAYASLAVAARCFADLRAHGPASELTVGAERFAAGDLRAAGEAWQPLVRDSDERVGLLDEAMVRAFAAAGATDLALVIARRSADRAPLFAGATLAMARGAQVAAAHGDRAAARELAARVRAAWATADRRPPLLDQLPN
jgi:tRNA A-37 threonylcarbamoyl transferase component Bud32